MVAISWVDMRNLQTYYIIILVGYKNVCIMYKSTYTLI